MRQLPPKKQKLKSLTRVLRVHVLGILLFIMIERPSNKSSSGNRQLRAKSSVFVNTAHLCKYFKIGSVQ